jgi:hypothetical protein
VGVRCNSIFTISAQEKNQGEWRRLPQVWCGGGWEPAKIRLRSSLERAPNKLDSELEVPFLLMTESIHRKIGIFIFVYSYVSSSMVI